MAKLNTVQSPSNLIGKMDSSLEGTHMKNSLRVNMRNMLEREDLPDPNKINSLNIIIGYNQSDQTFGWNGFNNALQMYFFDPDEIFIANEKKVVLLPTLNPSVTLTQRVTELLGQPFTKCNRDLEYSKRNCEVLEYMSKVVETCGCYPSYDYSYKTILTDQYWVEHLRQRKSSLVDFNAKPCNFFEQSTCITSLQQGFDEAEFSYECLPKCSHTSTDQKKIHVSHKKVLTFSNKSFSIKLLTMVKSNTFDKSYHNQLGAIIFLIWVSNPSF